MKILMLLSNSFIQDPRVYQEAKSLVKDGHEIVVIVWDRNNEYRSEEYVEGIRVIRIKTDFILKKIPVYVREIYWWIRLYLKAVAIYKSGFKFDVVHAHDLDTLPAGYLLKSMLKVKLVYDAHEIFRYYINQIRKVSPYAVSLFEKTLFKKVDILVTVNDPLKKYFSKMFKGPIEIIINVKKLIGNSYIPINNKSFTICYFGVLSQTRFLPDAISILGSMKNVRFLIAGRKNHNYEKFKRLCNSYDNVNFLGTISLNEVISCTLGSDAVLCMVDPLSKNGSMALANKQFEAMVCGRPIIATNNTYIGEITNKFNCGIVTDYSKDGLISAVNQLLDHNVSRELGINALKAAVEHFNWDAEEKKLLKIYEGIR